MQQLPFYFDFLSPYSFLAWQFLQKNSSAYEQKGLTLDPRPLSMGSLMARYEIKGPAQIPSKRDQLWREALRKGARLGIEIKTPVQLPFNHVHLLKLAVKEVSGEFQTQVISILFAGIWTQGLVMEEPQVVEELLLQTLPKEQATMIWERSSSGVARQGLRQNLEAALAHGAFGVPSLIYQDELFWGVDALTSFAEALAGNDLLDREQYAQFTKLFAVSGDEH